MIRILAVIMLYSFCASPALAQEAEVSPQSWATKGDLSYQSGNYALAARAYGRAIEEGLLNADLLYNRANALYRLGKFGEAISLYRRALQLQPRSPDVRANLALARRKALDKIEQPSEQSGLSMAWVLAPREHFSRFELLAAGFTCYGLFWLLFAFSGYKGKRSLRWAIFALASVSLYVFVLLAAAREGRKGGYEFALSSKARSIRPAVVTDEKAELRSGDSERFQVVFVLHEGAEVEVDELREKWAEVLLPDGRSGWIRTSALAIL